MQRKLSKCTLILIIFTALVGFDFKKYDKYVLYKHDVEQTKTNIRLMYNMKSEDWTFEKFDEKDSYMLKDLVRVILKNDDEIESIVFLHLDERDLRNVMHHVGLQLTPHMVKAIRPEWLPSEEVKTESVITDDFLLTVANFSPNKTEKHLSATFTFDKKSVESLFDTTLKVLDME